MHLLTKLTVLLTILVFIKDVELLVIYLCDAYAMNEFESVENLYGICREPLW